MGTLHKLTQGWHTPPRAGLTRRTNLEISDVLPEPEPEPGTCPVRGGLRSLVSCVA